jgi:hypothetical protein
MTISGTGGGKTQTTVISILDSADVEIQELTLISTKEGSFQTIWTVQSGLLPGTYKIKATIGAETAETTFTVQ